MQFNLSTNLSQAWHLLKGVKGPIWVTFIAALLAPILLIVAGSMSGLLTLNPDNPDILPVIPRIILIILAIILTAPFFAGIKMIVIKQARGEPVTLRTGFAYFHKWIPVAIAFIIIFIITGLLTFGFDILISYTVTPLLSSTAAIHNVVTALIFMLISSLFFILVYSLFLFSVPLIADRNYSPLRAIQQSFLAVKPHWLKIIGLLVIFYALNLLNLVIAEIPYVGLVCYTIIGIWLLPFIFMNIGVAYHQLIDRENHAQSLMPSN